jgi:YegS/Rv2252/BmrU family lipid kinase
MSGPSQKVLVVFNAKAGNENHSEEVFAALARHFTHPDWTVDIHETTDKEDIAAVCRAACGSGASRVIAAGGDGTVLSVAKGLVHGSVPLGILPLGTGNFLARALRIPMNLDQALDLLVGDHDVIEVDAMRVDKRFFFSNVGVGMSPEAVLETKSRDKRIFGRLSYVIAIIKQASIFRLRRYMLQLDGRTRLVRAAEVLISNTTLLQKPRSLFGPPETLGDGQLEAYVITARTVGDYMRLVWDLFLRSGKPTAKLSHWEARQSVRIDSFRRFSLVQADGEMIGHTPVEIRLVPKALRVIVPRASSTSPKKGAS